MCLAAYLAAAWRALTRSMPRWGAGHAILGVLWILRDGERYYCPSYDIELPDSWFPDLVGLPRKRRSR